LLCVGVYIKVECLFGEPNKNFGTNVQPTTNVN
jgi:hypothetical protein